MDASSKTPTAAVWLGYAGAIPFILGAALLLFGGASLRGLASGLLLNYGAIILSFLGGVHWGASIARDDSGFGPLGRSVTPALVALIAITVGGAPGLGALIVGFCALLLYDEHESRDGRTPGWYPKLRRPLTALVVGSLIAGLFA